MHPVTHRVAGPRSSAEQRPSQLPDRSRRSARENAGRPRRRGRVGSTRQPGPIPSPSGTVTPGARNFSGASRNEIATTIPSQMNVTAIETARAAVICSSPSSCSRRCGACNFAEASNVLGGKGISRSSKSFAGQPQDQRIRHLRSAVTVRLTPHCPVSTRPALSSQTGRVRQWDGEFARFRRRLGARPGPRRA